MKKFLVSFTLITAIVITSLPVSAQEIDVQSNDQIQGFNQEVSNAQDSVGKIDANGNVQFVSDEMLQQIITEQAGSISVLRRTQEFTVNANNVAFRRQASTSSEVIYRLQSGTIVTSGATSNVVNNDGYSWRFVEYNGVWGYVADMYLDDVMS